MACSSAGRCAGVSWWLAGLTWLVLLWHVGVEAADIERYLEDAQNSLDSGDIRTAVIQLKKALQAEPDNAEARLLLGSAYLRVGNGAGAEKEIRRARSLGMAKERWLIPLGRAYLAQGQFEQLLSEIESEPGLPKAVQADAIALRGTAYLVQQDLDQANATYQKALEIDPESMEALIGMARLSAVRRDTDQALTFVEQAIARDPKRAEAWIVKGELHRIQGQNDEALMAFERALEVEPGSLAGLMGRAAAAIAAGAVEKAEKDVDLILEHQPNYAQAIFLKALIEYGRNQLSDALEHLLVVLRAAPQDQPANLLAGAIYFRQDRYELAEAHLSRYVNANPQNPQGLKLLAANRLKMQRADETIQLLEPAVVSKTTDAQLLALLGSAYLQAGQHDKGQELLQRAVELQPDVAVMRTQLALGRLAAGEVEQAQAELEAAVDLGQGLFQADVLLVMLHMKKGSYDQAIEVAQRLIEKMADNPLPYNLMGAAQLARGDTNAARAAFQRALDIDPNFTPAALNLAQLDLREGNTAGGQARLLALLERDPRQPKAMLTLARLEDKQGNHQRALEWVEKAHEADPEALEPALMLINYYSRTQDRTRAVVLGRELRRLYPDNPDAVLAFAQALLAAEQYAEAIPELRRAVDLAPAAVEPRYLAGVAYLRQDDLTAARAQIDQVLALDPVHLPSLMTLVQIQERSDHLDEASQTVEVIKQKHPESAVGYRLEGDLMLRRQAYNEAADAYGRAYEREPSASLAVRRYQALKGAGAQEDALAPLIQWLEQHPEDLPVLQALAVAHQEMGYADKAIASYGKIVERDPNNIIALNNLAWLYQEADDPQALEYADRAYRVAPDRPEVADTLGWILYRRGTPEKAIRYLEQAVTQAPHRPDLRYHLALALEAVGRKSDARLQLERALETGEDFADKPDAQARLRALAQ